MKTTLLCMLMFIASISSYKAMLPRTISTINNGLIRARYYAAITNEYPASSNEGESMFKSVPINIYVDTDVRSHMQMRNSDRKARVFLNKDSDVNIENLRGLIEKRFTALNEKPYLLRFNLPGVTAQPRPLTTSGDIELICAKIREAGSLQLFVEGKPGEFPPASAAYLIGMEDPVESTSFTMVSFYKFYEVIDPDKFSQQLFELWKPFKATGRVYVAKEGINAQCAIPSNVLSQFRQSCETLPMFNTGMSMQTKSRE